MPTFQQCEGMGGLRRTGNSVLAADRIDLLHHDALEAIGVSPLSNEERP